jgi:hypothetical protein
MKGETMFGWDKKIKLRIPLEFKGWKDGWDEGLFHDLLPGFKVGEIKIEIERWDEEGLQNLIQKGIYPEFTVSVKDVAVCPYCGKPFLKFSKHRKYCSDRCQSLRQHEKLKERGTA